MKLRTEAGFTLIETILGLTVMTILVLGITQLFVSNLQTVALGKARAIGQQLAAEQMETLRDLPYQSVATLSGAIYPPGTIADTQFLVRGGYTFKVVTEINYVDDPYDGVANGPVSTGPAAGKPQDLNPADYKKAQVSVYLKSSNKLLVQLTTDIAGKAAETASNTGIISVKVIDASGQPVQNATVHITNTNPTPDVDITTTTDNQGLVVVPNLPPDSSNRYQVSASLAGYSSDTTLPDTFGGAQVPANPNPNVLAQQISSVTLSIDRISTMSIAVVDTAGAALANKAITVTGAKNKATNPNLAKYQQTFTTDAAGTITLSNLEWDSYSFAPPVGSYLVSSQPYAPAALAPNSTLAVKLVLSTSSAYPTVTKVTPASAPTGTTNVSLQITGTNLSSGTSVVLRQTGQPDINVSGETSTNGNKTLTGTLNLAGAATGTWDIAVTSSGNVVTQTGGFNVTP